VELLVRGERAGEVARRLEHLRQRLARLREHAARADAPGERDRVRQRPARVGHAAIRHVQRTQFHQRLGLHVRLVERAPQLQRLLQHAAGVAVAAQQAQDRAGLAEAVRLVVPVAERTRELQRARHVRQPLRVPCLRRGLVGAGVAAPLGEQRLVEQQLGQQVPVAGRLRELDTGREVAVRLLGPLREDQRRAERVADVDLERREPLLAGGLERAQQRRDGVVVRAEPVLAQPDPGERGGSAGHVAARLVGVGGLEQELERRHEVREVEVAAREGVPRLGVELTVAGLRSELARFPRQRQRAGPGPSARAPSTAR